MTHPQQPLFPRKHRLLRNFEEFDLANPEVWRLFCKFVDELLAVGRNRYSADAVLHRIRWHYAITTKSDDGFKICNNHSAYYARKWMRLHPEHPGFFQTRSALGDDR